MRALERARVQRCSIHIASGWTNSSAEIQDALCRRDLQVVWTALKRGFDPNAEFTDGWAARHTPLTLVLNGIDCQQPVSLPLVVMLVEQGADVNRRASIYGHTTPLLEAVRGLDLEVVGYLLAHGADPNAGDDNGRTSLMSVSGSKGEAPFAIVRVLLRAGANPKAVEKHGLTATAWFRQLRRPDIADFIEQASKLKSMFYVTRTTCGLMFRN